jgi:hypothetical protein
MPVAALNMLVGYQGCISDGGVLNYSFPKEVLKNELSLPVP